MFNLRGPVLLPLYYTFNMKQKKEVLYLVDVINLHFNNILFSFELHLKM